MIYDIWYMICKFNTCIYNFYMYILHVYVYIYLSLSLSLRFVYCRNLSRVCPSPSSWINPNLRIPFITFSPWNRWSLLTWASGGYPWIPMDWWPSPVVNWTKGPSTTLTTVDPFVIDCPRRKHTSWHGDLRKTLMYLCQFEGESLMHRTNQNN